MSNSSIELANRQQRQRQDCFMRMQIINALLLIQSEYGKFENHSSNNRVMGPSDIFGIINNNNNDGNDDTRLMLIFPPYITELIMDRLF